MVPSRLWSCRATSPLAAALFLLFVFAASSCSTSVAPTSVRAEDSKDAGAVEAETDPDYAVPDGTPDEIMKFIKKLQAKQIKFANRQESINHAIKIQRALISAGDKILNQKGEVSDAVKGAKMKLAALALLAANRIGNAPKEALEAVNKIKADDRPEVAKVADQFSMDIRVFNSPDLSAEERVALIKEVVEKVAASKFAQQDVSTATRLGDVLANSGQADQAGTLYDELAKMARDSDEAKFKRNAEIFEAIGRRVRLPGHFMALEGKLLKGGELDWQSYRGKVVLVDFWATWCGPCIGELPNVKECYKKYHDKGFEVIGVSLDKSKDQLVTFLEKEQIPWEQMFDETVQASNGWNHPMVRHYGINGIPAAFLVDKEGNVVSMAARGEELPNLLEKLLGKAE